MITIRLGKGRPIDKKRAFAEAVTTAVADRLEVRREWVTLLIERYDHENWATGGELHADKFGPGCLQVNLKWVHPVRVYAELKLGLFGKIIYITI